MKNLLITLALVLSTMRLVAQTTDNQHLMFKGVPIDGTMSEYVAKMKLNGFVVVATESGLTELEGDFASYKNNLKNHANGMFIFQIDADEMPSEYLVENLQFFLESNKEVDLFFVPRINTVEGLTPTHIKKWGWKVGENGWINFPDYQTRIYRRTSEIEWQGNVHERIVGYNTLSVLPQEEEYCLYHHKQIERQEKQNDYYDTI